MKKLLIKSISVFLVSLMVLSSAACSSNPKDETGDTNAGVSNSKVSKQTDTTTTDNKPPVEIVYWGEWGGEGEVQFQTMMDAFNKSQNKIVAKYLVIQDMYTKFLTAGSSGQLPDLMFFGRNETINYAPKGVIHPIDEYMARDGVINEDFFKEAMKELTYDGKLYGLPLTIDNRCLFYNKKVLNELGLQPPTTWDELADVAKKASIWKGDKLERAGYSLATYEFSQWLLQAGGQMLTDDGSKTAFNSEAGLTVLKFWDRLMNVDKVYKIGFEAGLNKGIDAFATGKTVMLYNGPWQLSTYEKYGKDLDFGIVPAPAGPTGIKASVIGGFGLVIPEGAKHKDEAWELMKWWLAVPENAAMYCKTSKNIPGIKAATQDSFFADSEYYKPFLEVFNWPTTKIRQPLNGYFDVETKVLIPCLQKFIMGKLTAEEALKEAQTKGDKMLIDMKNDE